MYSNNLYSKSSSDSEEPTEQVLKDVGAVLVP